MAIILGLAVAAATFYGAAASQIVVGGAKAGWTTGLQYDPVNTTVGSSLVFNYARGQHNVVQVAKPDCTFANATQVAGLTDTPFNLTLKHPGTFYYACSVSGHCDAGMLLTVHVSNAAPQAATRSSTPTAASGIQIKQPPTVGQSRCTPPVLVLGTNDTFQVANNYYILANPYPSKVVAIVQEKSQIVDGTGRAVPLSESFGEQK
ncbi:probable Mavicyanin at N-terminal half [Coccomyxa sp. Obi]|nr:probable Mavicyanin at N-terminal half [Coccomyxa sp. Obi]